MDHISYLSLDQIIAEAEKQQLIISELVFRDQQIAMAKSDAVLMEEMKQRYTVMKTSVKNGLQKKEGVEKVTSVSGLSGGDAVRLKEYVEQQKSHMGDVFDRTLIRALAAAEYNAAMGKICAAPTAGSCGILPAVLITAQEEYAYTDEAVTKALFTASAIGMVIAHRASVSGAAGGCQAECGSAAAMAAGTFVELRNGTPEMVGHACALTLKSMLGLVCDPVAGLVEVPCVKRNAISAVHALAAAEMALAGIESKIPVDEVIDAMQSIGEALPASLKETAKGGLAASNTAKVYEERMKKT